MSRIQKLKKNIIYGYASSIISVILGFISRTVFIYILNESYLGVYSLFTNVLGVLSFADLGLGTAMNFALYKPVADDDKNTIKSLMLFYKKSYRKIAGVITIIGIGIIPVLQFIVKDPGDVGNIYVYYLIFLFNTVSTYFVSYKFALVNAEQKNYVITRIDMIVNTINLTINIIVLLIFKNFLIYLLSSSIILLFRAMFLSFYLNKEYPYLMEKDVLELSQTQIAPIKKNVNALIFHKFAEVAIYQTDNIIISSFINVTTVGRIANYNILITSVNTFIHMIFNSATSSFGNLVAEGDLIKNLKTFKIYNFINFWIYGFSSISFYLLLTPFITLWIGDSSLIDGWSVFLICVSNYFLGQRTSFLNFKTAFGQFYDDKYAALIAAIINLVVSVVMVNLIGLPGIYIGTLVSGLFESIVRPIISYQKITDDNISNYFKELISYALVTGFTMLVTKYIIKLLIPNVTLLGFIGMCFIVLFSVNIQFWLYYRSSKLFKESKFVLLNAIGGMKK